MMDLNSKTIGQLRADIEHVEESIKTISDWKQHAHDNQIIITQDCRVVELRAETALGMEICDTVLQNLSREHRKLYCRIEELYQGELL